MQRCGLLLAALLVTPAVQAPAPQPVASELPLEVRMVTDEADAVLAILAKLQRGEALSEADWDRLFSSEGYRRLKNREASLQRDFSDAQFRQFVLSADLLARSSALAQTLANWQQADLSAAAQRVLAYLPAGTRLRAKIYPVIKPQTNSFVFELESDPAIFLYLDPELSAARFENTVAHELHHIGLSAACLSWYESPEFKQQPEPVRTVLEWAGAFGEGLAMLAAAGGPNIHPHAASPAEDRARWDRDVANFNADLAKVEQFFLDVLSGRLKTQEEIRRVGFSFFGVQGPWYTVGWKMAVMVEREFGRNRLISCLCNPAAFLAAYNEAAARRNAATGESLALWSPELLRRLGVTSESAGPPLGQASARQVLATLLARYPRVAAQAVPLMLP